MVVLVTGSSGQLGQSLQSVAGEYPQIKFIFADSSNGDITSLSNLRRLFADVNPGFCINAAAYTAVDKAESEPEKAFLINETGARNLAIVCKEVNITLIHISTDFVFDGAKTSPYSETDATNPQGVYALSKLKGEQAIAANCEKYFIIRTAWVFSAFGNNFMKTMLRLASEREFLTVVSDQRGTPTYAPDLARTLMAIITSGVESYGTYHYSNEGEASWYDFAVEILAKNDIRTEVRPVPTSAFPTPAKRPAYSVLDKTKIKRTFGISIRNWRDTIKKGG